MPHTVQQLAKLSGISVRTLHFYDEIGLLKPAYYGENNYRYYEEEQLLKLQQILFYRELGFQLNDIQNILNSNSFNKIEALKSHKNTLEQKLNQIHDLIKTLDKTIAHLNGEISMKNEELYYGFESEQQQQYQKQLLEQGIASQQAMNMWKEKTKHWNQTDKDNFIKEGEEINQALISAINKKLLPSSATVQTIIRRHHTWLRWNPTREQYVALSELYQTPEFSQFYEKLHPELLEFIVKAMRVFAERGLLYTQHA